MNNFEIGEKVVCINDRKRWFKLGNLRKNEMYTVVGFNPYDGGLILEEVKSPKSGFNAYSADRFRKVDYAFSDRIIQMIQAKKEVIAFKPKATRLKRDKLYSINFISLN